MGIHVELPAQQRKQSTVGLQEKEASKELKEADDHEAWQWGPFERLAIEDASSRRPTLLLRTGTPADTLSDSPDSSKNLMSPSISTTSSSPSSSSSLSPAHSGGCAEPFGGRKAATHQKLKKGGQGQGMNPSSFACNGELRPSRWESGRWSTNSSSEERSMRPRGERVCKCAAGVTSDVAAVCCCPLSLLHLLAIAFIKVPTVMVSKAVVRVKRNIAKKRRRAAVHEEDDESIPASSCPPSRCRSYEEGAVQTWVPAMVAFGDQRQWREYFDSPETGVETTKEVVKAKS